MKINKEFQNLITPLTEEEFNQLEKSIVLEGCRDALIVWDDILIDGHNRFQICNKHNIKFRTKEIKLKDKKEAKAWIIKNQFARRNLSAYDRSLLALKLEDLYKEKGKEKQSVGGKDKVPQKSAKPLETRQELATIAGVSHDTITKVKVIKEQATKEQEEEIRKGDKTINRTFLEIQRVKNKKELLKKIPKMPTGKFRVLLADPPWSYGNSGLDEYGHAERHYPTMSIQELCDMSIKEICEENAVLFLWTTSPILEDAFKIINAWGFKYKTSFVWNKLKHNFGYYNSVRHEFLLIATKGSCLPDNKKLYNSVVSVERTKHSEKPEEFREMIDKLYTHGDKIELFARREKKGWSHYGNEI